MRVKVGRIQEDVTAFGNRFWIQIEDALCTESNDHLKKLVGKLVHVCVDETPIEPLEFPPKQDQKE